jgi:hypothetical protein
LPGLAELGWELGKLRHFAGLPAGWQAEFTLLAEGGFAVGSARDGDGSVPFIRIASRRGGTWSIVSPWKGGIVIEDGKATRTMEGAEVISLPTVAGGVYRLRPEENPPSFHPIPLARADGPRWADRKGADDTAEGYLACTEGFGCIGIARGGGNPARQRVQRALDAGKGK